MQFLCCVVPICIQYLALLICTSLVYVIAPWCCGVILFTQFDWADAAAQTDFFSFSQILHRSNSPTWSVWTPTVKSEWQSFCMALLKLNSLQRNDKRCQQTLTWRSVIISGKEWHNMFSYLLGALLMLLMGHSGLHSFTFLNGRLLKNPWWSHLESCW